MYTKNPDYATVWVGYKLCVTSFVYPFLNNYRKNSYCFLITFSRILHCQCILHSNYSAMDEIIPSSWWSSNSLAHSLAALHSSVLTTQPPPPHAFSFLFHLSHSYGWTSHSFFFLLSVYKIFFHIFSKSLANWESNQSPHKTFPQDVKDCLAKI